MKRKPKLESGLLSAVKFVSLGYAKTESETDTHCMINNYSVTMNNNVIAIGHAIDEELIACPQIQPLVLALQRCGEEYAITMQTDRLSIRSVDFSAYVACCDPSRLLQAVPDPQICPVSDELTRALGFCLPVVSEKAEYLLNAIVQVKAGSALATNNAVLIEAFHGQDLPYMILPKFAVAAIVKCGKQLTGFGYSGNSATFWFGDRAWIKTKLFDAAECKFPDILELINTSVDLMDVPEGFFAAVKNVAPFSEDGRILVDGNKVSSHIKNNTGSRTEGISKSLATRQYGIKNLKLVEKFALTMDEQAHQKATFFYGNKIRAAVAHTIPVICGNPDCTGGCDICIPF
jgi:hypothetical protein